MNSAFEEPRARMAVCENYVVTVTSEFIRENEESIRIYGLQFSDHTGIFDSFSDITDDPDRIRELFSYFQRFDVDRSQISDVIEDYVAAMHFVV